MCGRSVTEELETRNKSIVTLFRAGRSRAELAAQFGITPQRVSQIISRYASGVNDDDARAVERAGLEAVRDRVMKDVIFGKPKIVVTPTGVPVYDTEGNPVWDYRDIISGADVFRKISDSIRRLDALDLPRRKQVAEDEAMKRVKEYLASLPQAEVIRDEPYPD